MLVDKTSSNATSPESDAEAADGEEGGVDLASLTVEDGEPKPKARRASVLSTSSGSQVEGEGSGKRKSARTGSFTRDDERPPPTSSSDDPFLPTPTPPTGPPPPPSVDIVNYPSADLLRLLASLLEQIARANDDLNQRAASSSSSVPQTPAVEAELDFSKGGFDAAPLNSPVTPRFRRSNLPSTASSDDDYLPVTPGVDLLNEVDSSRPGVAGFMPSLGGAHTPVPLTRRRGSSFLGASNPSPSLASLPVTEPPLTSLLTASSLALSSPSATLCFHARNIPAISIESYLLRILKYCPTTNEVFLSLLVYFDRMARVGLEAQRVGLVQGGEGKRLFAIDSFNVHRLVIAGVTVASKFFSDVFYTNSRYAKVGGLPLTELNQLELQFLLLNDFRLVIPLDELQRYADQLILFWVGRTPAPPTPSFPPQPPNPLTPTLPLTAESIATTQPMNVSRPRSVRSQPSSSGTSVTSTVTPGTPSTPRASDDGMVESGGEEEDEEGESADEERERARHEEVFVGMEED
ncbi:hypothetical protein RQP46_005563 [Phenoliferia psychrophenolica]